MRIRQSGRQASLTGSTPGPRAPGRREEAVLTVRAMEREGGARQLEDLRREESAGRGWGAVVVTAKPGNREQGSMRNREGEREGQTGSCSSVGNRGHSRSRATEARRLLGEERADASGRRAVVRAELGKKRRPN